jgi:hypothetical protein
MTPANGAGSGRKRSLVNWLWLNIPLMAVFFLAVAGIPLWLVLRRPDFAAVPADRPGRVPVTIAAR